MKSACRKNLYILFPPKKEPNNNNGVTWRVLTGVEPYASDLPKYCKNQGQINRPGSRELNNNYYKETITFNNNNNNNNNNNYFIHGGVMYSVRATTPFRGSSG